MSLLATPVLAAASAALAANITVYHVNPVKEGGLPINMNTADAFGDIYFDFRSKALPIECAEDPSQRDCSNAEVVSSDLVITKLTLEVNADYGEYGRCNICVNGTDGHGTNNCTDGEYICSCGGSRTPEACGSAVGRENLTDSHMGRDCDDTSEDWECWRDHVIQKTGGVWYSTVEKGYCGSSPLGTDGCTWRVLSTDKVVNKSCSDDSVYGSIEDRDVLECFEKCTDSGIGQARNTSSPCWIGCFYTTVLGPDAGRPGGEIAGVPKQELLQLWERAFVSSDESAGGCPALPVEREVFVI